MEAVLRARGGDVEETRSFDILGFAVELGEVAVGGFLVGAGCFNGSEKQTQPPARRWLASPLVRGADTHYFVEEEEVGVAAAGALVEAGDDDGAELEALRLVDGHDLHVVVARVDVGQREELVDGVAKEREVGERGGVLEALELVEVALGVL